MKPLLAPHFREPHVALAKEYFQSTHSTLLAQVSQYRYQNCSLIPSTHRLNTIITVPDCRIITLPRVPYHDFNVVPVFPVVWVLSISVCP